MGPVGWPEMAFIFVLALLLFGPKKMPELGRMVGKGLREFRRASEELKTTFDREMRNLEQEVSPVKNEISSSFYHDESYNYDYSSYNHTDGYSSEHQYEAPPAITESSASAPEGADLNEAAPHMPALPQGVIANETISGSGGPVHHTPEPASAEPAEHRS